MHIYVRKHKDLRLILVPTNDYQHVLEAVVLVSMHHVSSTTYSKGLVAGNRYIGFVLLLIRTRFRAHFTQFRNVLATYVASVRQ